MAFEFSRSTISAGAGSFTALSSIAGTPEPSTSAGSWRCAATASPRLYADHQGACRAVDSSRVPSEHRWLLASMDHGADGSARTGIICDQTKSPWIGRSYTFVADLPQKNRCGADRLQAGRASPGKMAMVFIYQQLHGASGRRPLRRTLQKPQRHRRKERLLQARSGVASPRSSSSSHARRETRGVSRRMIWIAVSKRLRRDHRDATVRR